MSELKLCMSPTAACESQVHSKLISQATPDPPFVLRSVGSAFYYDGYGFLEDGDLTWVCPPEDRPSELISESGGMGNGELLTKGARNGTSENNRTEDQ